VSFNRKAAFCSGLPGPQRASGERGAVAERAEFRPDDVRVYLPHERHGVEAAIDARDDSLSLSPKNAGIADDPFGNRILDRDTKYSEEFRNALAQVSRVAKDAFFDIRDVARNLFHPSIVGVRRDAGDVHRSGGDVDEEQHVVCDETLERVHLNAQKVRSNQTLPVSF
jgi:hypothetical protein